MRVLVNLSYLRVGEVGGSETYVRQLLCHFGKVDPSMDLHIVCNRVAADQFRRDGIMCHISPSHLGTRGERLFSESMLIPAIARRLSPGVLFGPSNFCAPFSLSTPQVVTIHDLQHEHFPENFSQRVLWARRGMLRLTLRRASRFIAISEFTRQDILRRYHIRPHRISAIAEGRPEISPPDKSVAERVWRLYGLQKPFFYYPAMLSPHKNHVMLFEAFRRFLKARPGWELILTGAHSDRLSGFVNRLDLLGIKRSVRHLGFIPHDDVLALMSLCGAVVFPSRFEGFGLPILEAMSIGAPVLTSNSGALPEVAGGGAVVLPPGDTGSWAEMMIRLAGDALLRDRLIRAGWEACTRFSWWRCAKKTIDVFHDAADAA